MQSKQYEILYPVDFSKRSTLATQYVKVWVEHFRAALDTLHIVNNHTSGPLRDPYDPALYQEQSRVVATRTADLKYFSDHHFGKNLARSVVLNGDTTDLIQHFADREQVDLIMLPRNHQSLMTRFCYDSLTATLLERCRSSIWMTEHLEDATSSVPSNVLCAVQFGDDATLDAQNHRFLQTVWELVSHFRADVTFLHVTGNKYSGEPSAQLGTKTGSMLWLEQAQGLFGSAVNLLRTSGNVIARIRDTANLIKADLVVVGRMRPGAVSVGRQSRLLKIDHALRCPVLSVW
jgi:nucleotide-binding universal stress UspA family protein